MTILVVNDNEAQNYALSRMLRVEGFRVLHAFNGQEALAEAQKKPQMILMDVNMPDLLGFEVCRLLKASATTADIPVVFISATYQYSYAHEQSRQAGGDGFLFYPVESGQLAAVIRGAMERGSAS